MNTVKTVDYYPFLKEKTSRKKEMVFAINDSRLIAEFYCEISTLQFFISCTFSYSFTYH